MATFPGSPVQQQFSCVAFRGWNRVVTTMQTVNLGVRFPYQVNSKKVCLSNNIMLIASWVIVTLTHSDFECFYYDCLLWLNVVVTALLVLPPWR